MSNAAPAGEEVWRAAVAQQVSDALHAPSLTSAYREDLLAALTSPGRILSASASATWARTVMTCCTAVGGKWEVAVPVAAGIELFMLALDLLDDEEDGETNPVRLQLGSGRALNVSTGLLLLAHRMLLGARCGTSALKTLLDHGLRACSGQQADIAYGADHFMSLDDAVDVAERKSGSLAAAACQAGAACAGANCFLQSRYAEFGTCLGMVAQLRNDLEAVTSDVEDNTDIALGRPTLPLVHAGHLSLSGKTMDSHLAPAVMGRGPVQLTWAVAESYRRRALAMIPRLAATSADQAELQRLVPAI